MISSKTTAALAMVLLLATGCSSTIQDQGRDQRRSAVPQSTQQTSNNQRVGVADSSWVLLRIFKQERELEMWRRKPDGTYVLTSRFEICSMSGTLGPKLRQGDRQAPEGFYEIRANQLNPHSAEWLSFNTGYPNAYDRAHHRTGSALMIHGGCSSAGCYAIKDGPMQDLYAAMRDAFAAGQSSIQLQIYPFGMSDSQMSAHRADPNTDFWNQLKAGYDAFERSLQPVAVSVVNGRYVVGEKSTTTAVRVIDKRKRHKLKSKKRRKHAHT